MQEMLQQLQAKGYPVNSNEAHFECLLPSRCKHIANPAEFDALHCRPFGHPTPARLSAHN